MSGIVWYLFEQIECWDEVLLSVIRSQCAIHLSVFIAWKHQAFKEFEENWYKLYNVLQIMCYACSNHVRICQKLDSSIMLQYLLFLFQLIQDKATFCSQYA